MGVSITRSESGREGVCQQVAEELCQRIDALPLQERSKKKAGRPQQVQWKQIVLGLVMEVFLGMKNYQQLWRSLRSEWIGGYAPVSVQDDAIIKRLKQAGTGPFEQLFEVLSDSQEEDLGNACTLAPFARSIVAIDDMVGDQVQRRVKRLWGLKKGDKQLLPGKLSGRFNLCSQRWERIRWHPEAQANCKRDAADLLVGLAAGSLILFDLGYFAFAWFDQLSQKGYWWISRLREKTSYELVHVFWRSEGNLDALVWLGAHRADRAGRLVRLVRIWDGGELHSYISNVLDPRQLSMAQMVQLYARRWDIELAFLLLKESLQLHHWWSSLPVLVEQQCLLIVLVAQEIHRLHMRLAKAAGVSLFEVSLPLVMQQLPRWLDRGEDIGAWMRTYGRDLGLIRPSTRLVPVVPEVPLTALQFPDEGLVLTRKERYHQYQELKAGKAADATTSKTGSAKKRAQKKQEKQEKQEKEAEKKSSQKKGKDPLLPKKKGEKKSPSTQEKESIPLFSG